jgi:hypothetical protein
MKYRISAFFVACALLSGCVSAVPVTIENHSRKPLVNVLVSGSGFNESVSSIATGGMAVVRVRPPGETLVKVAFEVDGQLYSATSSEKIANDESAVGVTVDDDFSITIDTNAR